MNTQECFTIYDIAVGAYLPPFFLPTVNVALRTFSQCINDQNHAFAQKPSDYTLFHIGKFDATTGQLSDHISEVVCNGVDVIDYEDKDEKIRAVK